MNDKNLYNILYISNISKSIGVHKQLDSIGIVSKRNNKNFNITGILVKINDIFIQLLEGEEKHLDYTLNKISMDIRHHNLNILSRKKINSRSCRNWEMAFLDLSSEKELKKTGYFSSDEILEKISNENSMNFLIKSLIKNNMI
jgi:hypothetical protein